MVIFTTNSLQNNVAIHVHQSLKYRFSRGSPYGTYHVYKLMWQTSTVKIYILSCYNLCDIHFDETWTIMWFCFYVCLSIFLIHHEQCYKLNFYTTLVQLGWCGVLINYLINFYLKRHINQIVYGPSTSPIVYELYKSWIFWFTC